MRLPLNTTGQLLPLTTAATFYTVFDMANIPLNLRDLVTEVTLYAATKNPGGGVLGWALEIQVEGITPAPLLVQGRNELLGPNGFFIAKVLDRFPLRGAGRITVSSNFNFGVLPVHVFGYYEISGGQDLPSEFRPFEPNLGSVGNNQAPFTYLPATVPAGAGTTVRIHQLDPTMPHIVNLFAMAESGGGGPPSGGSITVVDGSSAQTLSFIGNNQQIFDDIPFLPVDGTVGGLVPGFYLSTIDIADEATSWGTFGRG